MKASTSAASSRAGTSRRATRISTWPRRATPVPRAGRRSLVERVIEVGNIFKLGTRYSAKLGATYLDEQGQAHPIVMGSYGIGPARIVASAIEQRHDADGIIWPWSIAPVQVLVLPVNPKQPAVREMAERLYRELGEAGFEVMLDDREERPGVKFKDADLLGVPIRVTVGALLGREGKVEVRTRRDRQDVAVAPDGVVSAVRDLARSLAVGALGRSSRRVRGVPRLFRIGVY